MQTMLPEKGPVMGEFLAQFFQEDKSQRPEFDLGFASLRRRELVKLAELAGLKVNAALPATEIVKIMEGWRMEGKFDALVRKRITQADAQAKQLADQAAEIADLRARLDRLAPAGIPAASSGSSDLKPPAELPETGDEMADLRARAKAKGIKSFGMTKEALRAALDGETGQGAAAAE